MGYPGDQQQPGGWTPRQPSQSPYDPADDQADTSSSYGSFAGPVGNSQYGPSFEDTRSDSSYGGAPGGSRYDDQQGGFPYGDPPGGPANGAPPGGAPYDDPYGPDASYGAAQGGYGGGPGPHDSGPPFGGEGSYGAYDAPPDEFEAGRDKKRWIIGAAVVAGIVVVGGGTALALTSGGGGTPKPTATPQAAAPPKATVNPTPSPTETGVGDRLRSRTTDPRALTLNEIFKARTFKAGGRTYAMTIRRTALKCADGVHGTSFRKIVVRGGCNQVLRATFGNGKFVGTIGILNLRSQAAAQAAEKASHPKDAFIIPIPGTGSTKKIGHGLSLTTAEVDGHYLIMSWVEYPSGKKIAKSDFPAVTSFIRNTTLGSNLRPALNYRSMEGKPS
jgi:hypothetical protein